MMATGLDDMEMEMDTEAEPELRVEGTWSPAEAAGDTEATFHHPAGLEPVRVADARAVLARMAEEGPPGYRARTHGCRKMKYGTVGRVLAGVGVNLAADGATSAGRMYRESDQALGAPNYGARISETAELTSASASRLFDIFVQAAPEVIANMPNVDRCKIGERGTEMFDADGKCTVDGVTCLLGEPATPEHVAVCNAFAARASTPERGRIIAVAAMLSAAATCE
jgi:hypothetical protein